MFLHFCEMLFLELYAYRFDVALCTTSVKFVCLVLSFIVPQWNLLLQAPADCGHLTEVNMSRLNFH